MTKVAFIGKMFSGKSTAAQRMVGLHGHTRLAFADPVKEISALMLNTMQNELIDFYGMTEVRDDPWDFETIQQRKGENQVRKLLQLVGTELGRELVGYENVWVDILLREASFHENVAVDDCRFPNEAEALRANGFTIVRVDRPVEDRMQMMRDKYPANYEEILIHPSEMSLDSFEADMIFYAENLDDLYEHVDALVQGSYS